MYSDLIKLSTSMGDDFYEKELAAVQAALDEQQWEFEERESEYQALAGVGTVSVVKFDSVWFSFRLDENRTEVSLTLHENEQNLNRNRNDRFYMFYSGFRSTRTGHNQNQS